MAETNDKNYTYGKRPTWQWVVIYALIGVIAYGLIHYFFLAPQTSQSQLYNNQVEPTVTSLLPTSATEATEITVTGNEFAFSTSKNSVKLGQPVQLTFKNTGKYPHNFVVSDLNVQTKTIEGGQEDTITFTPDKTGSFTFICSVPGHEDKGMTGTLNVL